MGSCSDFNLTSLIDVTWLLGYLGFAASLLHSSSNISLLENSHLHLSDIILVQLLVQHVYC
jgi:hypothetical protein